MSQFSGFPHAAVDYNATGFVTRTIARIRLTGKMAHDDLVRAPPVPPAIIQYAVWLYLRFTLSYRDVEDLLAERGLDVSYETVRRWTPATSRSTFQQPARPLRPEIALCRNTSIPRWRDRQSVPRARPPRTSRSWPCR